MTDIVLGGRIFAPANFDRMTSLMECHLMSLLRKSGLDRVLPEKDDMDAAWLMKLHAAVVDCGCMHELLAAYLLPIPAAERDWTRALAAETARFLEQLDTPEDRARVHELALEVTFGFFQRGVESLRRSQSALESLERSNPPSPPSASAQSAAPSTPATGRRSSGWWRGLISIGARKSRDGRSASC